MLQVDPPRFWSRSPRTTTIAERAPTGEVYGYDKRHGREAAWDVVQRHEMVGVFKWPAMRGSKGMHHLPDCVKEYFTSATDAAEADPKARRATTTKTNCG